MIEHGPVIQTIRRLEARYAIRLPNRTVHTSLVKERLLRTAPSNIAQVTSDVGAVLASVDVASLRSVVANVVRIDECMESGGGRKLNREYNEICHVALYDKTYCRLVAVIVCTTTAF